MASEVGTFKVHHILYIIIYIIIYIYIYSNCFYLQTDAMEKLARMGATIALANVNSES